MLSRIKKFFIFCIFLPLFGFSQNQSITLYFGGDCTLANHFENFVQNRFDYPFEKIKWFADADISMVNLENPVSLRGKIVPKEFNFRMNPKYLEVLKNAGVDIVTSANNHSCDYGNDAIYDTMQYLDSAGIKFIGIGKNIEQARSPVIIQVKGKRIGFLGYFGGGWYAAQKNSPGVAPRNEEFIKEDIKKLKEKVDYVVVNYHWGEEGSHLANNYQINLGHMSIDAGADLVIGHHPHVLQGIEKYKNGFIVYSLGNFLFGGNSRKEYDTAIFKLLISENKLVPEIVPIHVSYWQAVLLEGSKKNEVINSLKDYSRIFNKSIF